jgi:fumarate reductase flavoprotein subunit
VAHLLRLDGTGHAMLTTMSDQAIAHQIPVHERAEAIAVIHDGARCYGAIVRNLVTGELAAYVAKATAITGGGAGRLYRVTTNAVISEGIPTAIARDGSRPSAIWSSAVSSTLPFLPEFCSPRAPVGTARLLKRRQPSHADYEPEKGAHPATWSPATWKSTSPRQGREDTLWRPPLAGYHVGNTIKHNLREVYGICHYFLGVDPVRWVPVGPLHHGRSARTTPESRL